MKEKTRPYTDRLTERTRQRMLSFKRKIEELTGGPLTHETFIDTLLNYEAVIDRSHKEENAQ